MQAAAARVPLAQSAGGDRGDIEDAAALVLRFANGGVGSIQIAWTRDELPGQLLARRARQRLLAASRARPRLHAERPLARRARRGDDARHPIDRTLERFLAAARAGEQAAVFCTPADAAGTLAVAVACEEALAGGATVAVPAW